LTHEKDDKFTNNKFRDSKFFRRITIMGQNFATAYAMNYQPEGYKDLIAYQLAFNESMRLY